MLRRLSLPTLLITAAALAACSPDLAVAPTKTVRGPALAMNVAQQGRYMVLLNNGAAKTFSERVTSLGGTVKSYHAGSGFAVVTGLSEESANQLGLSGLATVQPDIQVALDKPITSEAAAFDPTLVPAPSSPDAAPHPTNPTAAFRFSYQWNMNLIKAPAAWAAGKLGSASVRVAILDSGLDYDAPDLNGLVDLGKSVSFMSDFVGRSDNPATPDVDESDPIVPADDQIVPLFAPFLGPRHLVSDLNGHGTNVATQVSSKAAYVAGVTSKTTLFGVKVIGANGVGNLSDILNGVLYAADNDADIANMSLGGGFAKAASGRAVSIINRVFNYARQKNMLIVVAAGNDGIDLQHIGNGFATYCDAPHVICVSSVGPRVASELGTSDEDTPAFYSNFGRNSVDIAAPGGNGDAANGFPLTRWPWSAPAPGALTPFDQASWVWAYCAKTTLVIQRAADNVHGRLLLTNCLSGNHIWPFFGTSQASPHVAGLAALLVAENGKGKPEQIKHLIQGSADPIAAALGRGRINVKNALGL